MKKNKKKVAKKKVVKKSAPKSRTEIVVRVEQQPNFPTPVTPGDLLPEKSGSKYMIPKTWMSEKQVLRIIQKTPPQHVMRRPGKGGKDFDYVSGVYVTKVLNFTFGWNWDFEVISHGKEGNQLWVLGKLTVKDDKGHTISKTQFGRSEVKFMKNSKEMVDFGNDLKSATTDALKKCASMLGIASDIYGKSEFKEAGHEVHPDNNYTSQKNPKDIVVDYSDTQDVEEVKKGQVKGPDGKPTFICADCGAPISDEVAEFSMKMYGKRLCREDQKSAKKK